MRDALAPEHLVEPLAGSTTSRRGVRQAAVGVKEHVDRLAVDVQVERDLRIIKVDDLDLRPSTTAKKTGSPHLRSAQTVPNAQE
jgi:hypothetical protein